MQIKFELDMPNGKANDCTNPKTSYLFCKVLGAGVCPQKSQNSNGDSKGPQTIIMHKLKSHGWIKVPTKWMPASVHATTVVSHGSLSAAGGTTSAAYWDMVTCRVVTTKYGSKMDLFDRLRTRGKGITVYVNDVNIMWIKNTNCCFYGPSFSAWEGSKTNWHALRITVCLQDMCKM